jgi:hypothetical protein
MEKEVMEIDMVAAADMVAVAMAEAETVDMVAAVAMAVAEAAVDFHP